MPAATSTRPERDALPIDDAGDGRKMVITLGTEAAHATRRMAKFLKISAPEAVRRGLMLLDLVLSLGPDEELVIRNTKTNSIDRIRMQWGFLSSDRTPKA